ncbi:hypothetical protein F4823DRAFT_636699 [Ustulina deusta]|nr:hypothetical protein F4823DRAFT_636699 [Ustulina deusta]
MYKTRFTRWGWRKNRTRDQPRTVVPLRQSTIGAAVIRHMRTPDFLRDQEDPISISRNYTINVSEFQNWCSYFEMTEPTPHQRQHGSVTCYIEAEAAFSDAAIQLGNGQTNDAFRSLNKLFDALTGKELYFYPQYPAAFWLLCHGIYNACTLVKDSTFRLLRELLAFLAQNSVACFKNSASVSSHHRVSLMLSLLRMCQDNPSVMEETFRTACRATAESLEVELGSNHPVTLITWLDYFWYFNFPVDPGKNLVARYLTALNELEATWGREADITIIFLHNLVIFLFYCVHDEAETRQRLSDLLERINHHIAAQRSPTVTSLRFQRAYVFGSLLQGLFILEDHSDLGRCERVIRVTIEWLKDCGGRVSVT